MLEIAERVVNMVVNVLIKYFQMRSCFTDKKVLMEKIMLYIQQSSVKYLTIFELLNTFRKGILLWFELHCTTVEIGS